MEPLLLFYLLLGVISFLSVRFLRYKFYKPNPKPINGNENFPTPPGTTGWPLIGETLDYLSNLREGALEKFVSDRRKKYSSEVFKTSLFGYRTAIFCGAKGNKFLFTNERKLVQVWVPRALQTLFPKSLEKPINYMKVRKIFPAALKGVALQSFVGSMDAVMKQHVRTYEDCEQINVHKIAGDYILAVSCRCLLGNDEPLMYERFVKPVSDIAQGLLTMGINLPWSAFNRALKASDAISEELKVIIRQKEIDILEKRVSTTYDMLSQLLLAKDENGRVFNEMDIVHHLVGFLFAGFDPIRATLTFTLKYLAELPDVYDKVVREQMEIANSKEQNALLNWEDTSKMKYSWNVVNEVFRMTPPILGTFREAITDFEYMGHVIPKGTKIHWNAHSTHKDPSYFQNPKKFDPSRFEGNGPPAYAFVPFGGGPRMCPGNDYSKQAILVFLHNFVTKFKWELLIPDERVIFDPHPKPVHGLPIRLQPLASLELGF